MPAWIMINASAAAYLKKIGVSMISKTISQVHSRRTEILEQRGNSRATKLRKHGEERMALMSDRATKNVGQRKKSGNGGKDK